MWKIPLQTTGKKHHINAQKDKGIYYHQKKSLREILKKGSIMEEQGLTLHIALSLCYQCQQIFDPQRSRSGISLQSSIE